MINISTPSIRQQLMVMSSTLLIVFTVVTYWAANAYGHRAASISYDRLLIGAALQIAESVYFRDGEVFIDLPKSAFEILSLAPNDRVFYAITTGDGILLTGYRDLPIAEKLSTKRNNLDNREQLLPRFFNGSYKGESVRFLTMTKQFTEVDFNREVKVQLGQTTIARKALAEEVSWRALQFVIIFFCVVLLLIMGGVWLVLRPLHKLNSGLESRSSQDLSPLVVTVPKELKPLLNTINRFMTQLEATLDGLKHFTGEAAHQIRTPLAGLKSQAQNALKEKDETRRNEQIQRVVECSNMLSDTVTQLLNQATIVHRFQSQAFKPVTLDELVKEVCRDVAVTALQMGVEVIYLGKIKVEIEGDDFSLKQMIRNFMENAIKFSQMGDSVQVSLSLDEGCANLSISDQGPGIPADEKDLVFERFYRSPSNRRSGSGLGLAIAWEVALYHKAELKLRDNQPHGLVVEIRLPASKGYNP
jgi:two-component system sensor histidine kinase TctE